MDVTISVLESNVVQNDQKILHALYEIAEPYYTDPIPHITHNIQRCKTIYLATQGKEIISFFMFSRENLNLHGTLLPAVYMGLGITHETKRGIGIIQVLFDEFIKDVQQWDAIHNFSTSILWHRTASSFSFQAVDKLFQNCEPKADGSYTQRGATIATAICEQMGWIGSSKHPFVLTGVAKHVSYSDQEQEIINSYCVKKNFTLFSDLGINEANGDRLLRICFAPKS